MTKELPFCLDPPIISYQYHAFSLGILSLAPNFPAFLYSRYTNLYYRYVNEEGAPDVHGVDFVRETWFTELACFDNCALAFEDDHLFHFTQTTFMDMVRTMLDQGYYITGAFDAYYQPNHPAYRREYHPHDYLIHGYDDRRGELIAGGYGGETWKYQRYTMPYADLYNGVRSMHGKHWIHFLRIKEAHRFQFDLHVFKKELDDYCHARSTYGPPAPSTVYGLGIYAALLEDLRAEQLPLNPLGFFRILKEHKHIMYGRMTYLLEQGVIHDSALVRRYAAVVDAFEILYQIILKYKEVPFTSESRSSFINRLEDAAAQESTAMATLYQALP